MRDQKQIDDLVNLILPCGVEGFLKEFIDADVNKALLDKIALELKGSRPDIDNFSTDWLAIINTIHVKAFLDIADRHRLLINSLQKEIDELKGMSQ